MTLYPISPTKLGTWLDCPRRFWLQYVERVKVDASWAHLSMGNAIHYALRDWWDVAPDERSRERLDALMAEHWDRAGFRDEAQSEQWRTAAVAMTWRYVEQCEPGFVPHSCERSLGARTEGQAVTGRIDRLDPVPGDETALVVVDYKTGKRVPSEGDVRGSLALAMYAMCVEQSLKRRCRRVELHHIPSGARVGWDLTDESLARQRKRIEQIGGEMAAAEAAWRADGDTDEHFPPQPGPLCGWCDYRAHCEAGASAPKQPSWSGLPDEAETAPDDLP